MEYSKHKSWLIFSLFKTDQLKVANLSAILLLTSTTKYYMSVTLKIKLPIHNLEPNSKDLEQIQLYFAVLRLKTL